MLVVKRGPNAGSRFLLDRPVTSVGRRANGDIVVDEPASASITRVGR